MFFSSQPVFKKSKRNQLNLHLRTQPGASFEPNHSRFIGDSVIDRSKGYVVILPYICDESCFPVKRPILATINLCDLSDCGFRLPFKEYENIVENLFTFTIQGHQIFGKLISVARSMAELKKTLGNNIKSMPDLSNLPKILKIDGQLELNHAPLQNSRQLPTQTKLSQVEFSRIFESEKSQNTHDDEYLASDSHHQVDDDSIEKANEIFKNQPQSQRSCATQKSSVRSDSKESEQPKESSITQQENVFGRITTKSKRLTALREKISKLEDRKNLLSEFDTTGSTIRSLIDVTKELLILVDEDNIEYESHMNHILVQPDPTFKNTASNRIFLEGCLPLELDSYEKACKKSRFKSPGSFAYQMVKFAFPKVYATNVTLGKKEMSEREFESKLNHKKKPLAFVLGFSDPLDKPFEGDSCLKRGEKRINALIAHIFRKSGKLEYTTADEMQVRSRIVKELSRKNEDSHNNDQGNSNDEDSHLIDNDYLFNDDYSFDY